MNKLYKLILVNLITLIRVIGTIIVLMYYNCGGIIIGTMTIFIYFSDVLDGVLARKWNCSTFFGAVLDGVADKLFTIVSFIVLYLIVGKIALVPVFIELLICIVQLIKFALNMNIKSNVVGKLKVWVLAICIVLTYFASDINNFTILNPDIIDDIANVENLYFYTLLPAILFEIITLISYIIEVMFQKNIEATLKEPKKVGRIKLTSEERKKYIQNVWLSPEFYEAHKDEANLRELRKETKKKIS